MLPIETQTGDAMKRHSLLLVAAAAAALSLTAQAAGTVQVNFVNPDGFSDVRDSYLRSDRYLELIKQNITEAALPYLADGQVLKVEVLDVDLAGEVRYGARPYDVRVLKGGADWPRIQMRYAVEAGGQTVKSGEATVQDMAYLQRTISAPGSQEALRYERRMLDDWFKANFSKN
jgi:Protein of unknown function (DUF3016)